ncbi:MAG TPA: hypothetical protein VGJ54_04070, partial [Streptosporangiaceae bacterium]
LGFALTLVLPEPAGRSLEDMPTSTRETSARPLRVAGQHQPTEDPASAALPVSGEDARWSGLGIAAGEVFCLGGG